VKAFLSHAHEDKPLVEGVAHRVGRPFVSIDTTSFSTGDDLLSAMERAVRESAIFVFFASRASMKSAWVNFELREARYHQALTRIRKVVVVMLDDRIRPEDLPAWMRRSKFIASRSPNPIARVIRQVIDDLIEDQQHGFFVGRGAEIAALQAAFVPTDTTRSVSLVGVRGLPGIGRRTLIARVARDTLSYERILVVRVEVGDSATTLAIKLADLVAPMAAADESLATARRLEALTTPEACVSFVESLEAASALNELVILYDDGGLLDNEGRPAGSVTHLLQMLADDREHTVVVVTNRRPHWRELEGLEDIPVVDVGPLKSTESKQLLALSAKARGISLAAQDITALAEQVRGYPVAANAAIQAVKTYGSVLVVGLGGADYQPRPLTRYLRSLNLSTQRQRILRVLASNSPLPLQVLAATCGGTDQVWQDVGQLIDASLVIPDAITSWYRINDPIVDYIQREYGPCTQADYESVARSLDSFLASDSESSGYLELARVQYRALTLGGRPLRGRAYALMSDWLRLAAEFYHQRDYEKALTQARAADDSASSVDSLTWLAKCHVKLGQNDEALEVISRLTKMGDIREAHFLRGFLERHRGRHRRAIEYYELAKRLGRGGLAIERDLADCYFTLGDYDRALIHVEAAQAKQSDNAYVIDLRIRIACAQRDEETARSLLPLLKAVDDQAFALHRTSRVELTFGDVEEAYLAAKQASAVTQRPPLEALATLALCELKTGRDAAPTVDRMGQLYRTQRAKVQETGLRARIAIAEQRFEDALGYCAGLEPKDSRIHQSIKRDALVGLLEHKFVAPGERESMQREIAYLTVALQANYGTTDWFLDD
jgi:tetratricopeptide (TPR) repeat protein